MTSLNRITIDSAICHGKPCIRGMRWPAEVVLYLLGPGRTITDILADHPEQEREDITASLNLPGWFYRVNNYSLRLNEVYLQRSRANSSV